MEGPQPSQWTSRKPPGLELLRTHQFRSHRNLGSQSGTIFDNFLITNNAKEAEKVAVETYEQLKEAETKARDAFRELYMAIAKKAAAEVAAADEDEEGEEESKKEETNPTDKAADKPEVKADESSGKQLKADSHKHEL